MAKQDEYVRYTVRLPPTLHEQVQSAAAAKSINAEIVERLDRSFSLGPFGELLSLDLKQGDRFVLHYDGVLGPQAHEHLQRAWRAFIGADDIQLLILEEGMRLGVVRIEASK